MGKMKKHIKTILLLTVLVGCKKLDIEKGTPQCVKNKIEDFNKLPTCDDGTEVKEYLFQSNTVYVFYPGSCGADMSSEVIDSECNTLGYLGGISGNTKINGEEFSNAVYQKTTWQQ